MPHPQQPEILALITAKQSLVQTDLAQSHDYQSLKIKVMNEELAEELRFLTELFSGEDIEARFKAHCRERAIRNATTCLSFSEMPNGAVNELYWDIATHLFHPATMGEMLGILMPAVTTVVTHTAEVSTTSTSPKDIVMGFKSETISSLNDTPSLQKLADFVVSGTKLLDVKGIARFDFRLHQRYYRALEKTHPDVHARLYQHNPALRTLKTKLLLLEGQGQVPFEVMTTLIRELRLGGSRMTGSVHAAACAQQAFAAFMGYLEALPLEARTTLLALTNSSGKTVESVIDALRGGNCVETAAQSLQTIIEQPAARAFLNKHPSLSPDYLHALVKDYRVHTLPTTALDSSTIIPPALFESALSEIRIDSAYDYISLLLSFPITLYKQLLQHANRGDKLLLPIALADRIKEGVLSEEQKQAFFEAIEVNQSRFSKSDYVGFYMSLDPVCMVRSLFGVLPPGDRLVAVKEKNTWGSTFLHRYASNPEVLRATLELLPKADRLLAIKEKDGAGNTVLDWAVANPEALRTILELLPEGQGLEVVKEKDEGRNTLLHKAASNPEALRVILELFPEGQRFAAVKEKDMWGNMVLHRAASNPEALRVILELLPKSQRIAAVKEKNPHGNTVFFAARAHPASALWRVILEVLSEDMRAVLILETLPKSQRLAAVEADPTVLHRASANPALLCNILDLLPESERFVVLQARNRAGNKVFHLVASEHQSSLRAILELLPPSYRFAALTEKDNYGNTVLHLVTAHPAPLHAILELLPEGERFAAVKVKDRDGNTALHLAAIAHPAPLRAILELLPEGKRFAALTEKDDSGNTVLHLAAIAHLASLRSILELLPGWKRLAAVKEKDRYGNTLLHRSATNPEALRAILAFLPEDKRLEAVKEKNNDGYTALHLAAIGRDSESLRVILAALPEGTHLQEIKEKDIYGNTLLHLLASGRHLVALRAVLKLYPESQRLAAITEKNSDGDTVLHKAVANPDALRTILELLPARTRLAALHEKNSDGGTVLQLAAAHLKLSRDILVLGANTTGLPITLPSSELFGLIDRIAACQISTKDTLLQKYVAEARMRGRVAVTPKDIDGLKAEFHDVLKSVSSPEILAVRQEIAALRGGVTLTTIGKNRKANRIENALCALPLLERGRVISGPHNKVQDEIARRRLLGIVDHCSHRLERVKREGVRFIY